MRTVVVAGAAMLDGLTARSAVLQLTAGLVWARIIAAEDVAVACLDLKVDCGAAANSRDDDSGAFMLCQQKLHDLGGGCVEIPPGDYTVRDTVTHSATYRACLLSDAARAFAFWLMSMHRLTA